MLVLVKSNNPASNDVFLSILYFIVAVLPEKVG